MAISSVAATIRQLRHYPDRVKVGKILKILCKILKILDSTSFSQKRVFHIVLLILAGSIVYANSLSVPFVLDDYYSIDYYGKEDLLDHLLHGTSRRVVEITLALNYRIHSLHVAGYHLTNLVIHLSAGITLYFITVSAISALRISFTPKDKRINESSQIEKLLPLAIALLFVIHPVQTQAVTYIIQRYTSLATLFYLLSVLCFLKFRLAFERNGISLHASFLCAGTIMAGILAVGSKQIAFTLPVMLLLLELLLFRGRLVNRRFFLFCGILFIIIVALILVKWHNSSLDYFFFDLRHSTSEDLFTSRTTYFLTQTRVVVTYLRLLCLPFGQSLVHEPQIYTTIFSIPVMASLTLHFFLINVAAALLRISRRNLLDDNWQCGVFQRLVTFGIVWFYVAMIIESSIFPIRDAMFEHRVYLPSAGFFIALCAASALAVQSRRIGMKTAWAFLAAACILLSSMTFARNQVWNNTLNLWQNAASKAPNKWLAQVNLAGEYLALNMPEKSLPLYLRAIELNSNLFVQSKVCLGDSLKALKLFDSRFTTGEEYVLPGGPFGSGALDYNNMSKFDSVINNNMGLAYEYMKKPEKAMEAYKMALTLNPEYDLAWYNLALLANRLDDKLLVDMALKRLGTINPLLAKGLLLK